MKPVDLMMFDFDGTLADTGEDIAASVNHALTALGLGSLPVDVILGFVGDGLRILMERALGADDRAKLEEAMKFFLCHYEKHLLDHTRLYPAAEEMLNHFHSKKKVILTNKRYYLTMAIAKGLKIDRRFLEIVGSDSTPFQKPDGRVVAYLLEKYGVAPSRAVLIGDSVNDVAAAKNAGVLSCVHLNGLGNREAMLKMGADFYVEHLTEIRSHFQ
ncbi:MAG TPA: HAD-IA family hydrolase [Smithellaceae bacterium]|jgi:phosphoglycolate phosphatase|nr:HAD-IA family hydrolase [Syntrophaceae bacterium]NMC92875.1 HAD-IA family hydrolase [Smithella sp.]HOE23501.1 HAD-IA family hydrolase [Smithellaceae bacterium]MBP9651243.1 HAD-IA family hydrolase [Syntrophaceae bacterium]HOU57354.1 HAD-IA family hydrolase [Smithellaceae bacterium]